MSVSDSLAAALDPYKNYRFRLRWGDKYVAGVTRVSALRRSTEVVRHSEGGQSGASRKSPGKTEYDAITLERGISCDRDFEEWANAVARPTPGDATDFRRDLVIELFDELGRLALRYKLFRCWVSEYQALPDLDASGSAVAIEQIKIENEGWVREDIGTPAATAIP